MIREGFENILDAWWLAVFPSLAILATALALSLLGGALRDAVDPGLRRHEPMTAAVLDIRNLRTEFRVGARWYRGSAAT